MVGLFVAGPALAQTTYVVDSGDHTGPGTLHQAVIDANASPGPDVIAFNLPPGAPLVVTVLAALPAITDPVAIDATTQPGYDGTPIVGLALSGFADRGLTFEAGSAGSTLRGLAVYRDPEHFSRPVACIELRNTTDVHVAASHVGLALDGTARGCGTGVRVLNSPANLFGGPAPTDRLVVSGNGIGIWITGPSSPSSANRIENAYVGTDPTGLLARPNTEAGLFIGGASAVPDHAAGTQIAGSVISGNGTDGHSGIRFEAGATGSWLRDSWVGLTVDGEAALGNGFHGVEVGSPGVVLEGNAISGNVSSGVLVRAPDVRLQGNVIGADPAGEVARPNGFSGVFVLNASGVELLGNTISGNAFHGVALSNSTGAVLHGNHIGTRSEGRGLLLNGGIQVYINGGTNHAIGGLAPGEGNLMGLPPAPPGSPGMVLVVFGDAATGHAIQTPAGEPFLLLAEAAAEAIQVAIDLAHDGPTPNDPGDLDEGPNDYQNYPDNLKWSERLKGILNGTYRNDTTAPIVLGLFLRVLVEMDWAARGGDRFYQLVSVGHDLYTVADQSGCGAPPCVKEISLPLPPSLSGIVADGDLVYSTATNAAGSTSELSPPVPLFVVSGEATPVAPSVAVLLGAAPNPFTGRTAVRYDLPRPTRVRLTVFDLLGREVRVLVEAPQDAGRHEAWLDGDGLPPGHYLYRLQADGVEATGRLIRTR